MKGPGRPRNPLSFPLTLWAFVELMRDREDGGERRTVRAACRLVQQQFADDLKGGRFLTVATIRRQHGEMEKAMRDDAGKKAYADVLLEYGRRRREVLGWDSSMWLYLIDPFQPGYDVNVDVDPSDGAIRLMGRRK
jgi:hypothetical protein